jgi:NADH-quinone oxidoreductase subunit J
MTVSLAELSFAVLAAVVVVSAVLVITRRNPVHSAIALIVTLLSVALLFLQLEAEFVAAVQIVVYVGGIMVLFLFVIMLVNLDIVIRQVPFNRQWHVAGLAALVLLAELGVAVYWGRGSLEVGQLPPPGSLQPNTELIGQALYQNYMLPFEIASLLLLVAMVGAVLMAKRR